MRVLLPEHHRRSADWAGLLALVGMWGTAFLFIRIGVETVPPLSVAAGRIATAAAVLVAAVRLTGLRFPTAGRLWLHLLVLGLVGNALPFFLIGWGQERIASGLAGILMAVIPIATLLLSHFLVAGERLTGRKLAGFALGFLGVAALMGREALLQFGGSASDLLRQAAVLGGALCYATNLILARRLPEIHPLVASASVMLVASLVMVPLALVLDAPLRLAPSTGSLVAVLWLGLVPTAAATIVYFRLVSSAGPTFVALVNYLIPIVAVAAGVAAFGERPGWGALLALALILSGIGLSQVPGAEPLPEAARRREVA